MRFRSEVKAVVALVAVLLAAGWTSSSAAAGTKGVGPVNYGVVLSFTGSSAFIGSIGNSGVYPAANEINAAGGILGHKLIVHDVDTKGDPADALPAVEQFLATTSNVLGINGPGTIEGPSLVPFLNRQKIVMMSTAGESEFNNSKFAYFWRGVPPDSYGGVAMALYARREGWTRGALVFGSDAGSQGDLPGVVAGAKAVGIKIVSSVNLSPSQPSYAAQVARVLYSNPQVIFTESDPTTAGTFFGELAQQTTKTIHVIGTAATQTVPYITPFRHAVGAARFARMFAAVTNQSAAPSASTAMFNHWLLKSGADVPNPKQWLGSPYSYGNYDWLILQALAATDAGSTVGSVYNKDIIAVANPGPNKTRVYSYAQGVRLLKEHKRIQYIGAGGAFNFNKWHNSFSNAVAEQYTAGGAWKDLATVTEAQIAAVKVTGVQ